MRLTCCARASRPRFFLARAGRDACARFAACASQHRSFLPHARCAIRARTSLTDVATLFPCAGHSRLRALRAQARGTCAGAHRSPAPSLRALRATPARTSLADVAPLLVARAPRDTRAEPAARAHRGSLLLARAARDTRDLLRARAHRGPAPSLRALRATPAPDSLRTRNRGPRYFLTRAARDTRAHLVGGRGYAPSLRALRAIPAHTSFADVATLLPCARRA